MFCKHDWEILSEHTTESQIEHANNMGIMITEGGSTLMFERKFIQIIKCDKCGKIKRYVTEV